MLYSAAKEEILHGCSRQGVVLPVEQLPRGVCAGAPRTGCTLHHPLEEESRTMATTTMMTTPDCSSHPRWWQQRRAPSPLSPSSSQPQTSMPPRCQASRQRVSTQSSNLWDAAADALVIQRQQRNSAHDALGYRPTQAFPVQQCEWWSEDDNIRHRPLQGYQPFECYVSYSFKDTLVLISVLTCVTNNCDKNKN